MWHKAEWMGHPVRPKLTRVGLPVDLANHYITRGTPRYIYISICVYIYISIMCIYIHTHVHTYVYSCIHMNVCVLIYVQIRWTRYVGHCWRRKDKLLSDVLLWTPSHGFVSVGWSTWTYLQHLCIETECSLEDLPGAMDDRGEWRERVKEIYASNVTWWYIYIWVGDKFSWANQVRNEQEPWNVHSIPYFQPLVQ